MTLALVVSALVRVTTTLLLVLTLFLLLFFFLLITLRFLVMVLSMVMGSRVLAVSLGCCLLLLHLLHLLLTSFLLLDPLLS